MYTLTGWISVAVGFLSLLLFLPGVFQVIVSYSVDSAAVSIFVVILVELTNTVFVNSTNITTNIKTAVLSNTRLEKSGGIVLKAKFRSFQCHPQRSR